MKNMKKHLTARSMFCLLSALQLMLCLPACKNGKDKAEVIAQKEIWTCSMHPEIVRDKPGSCPICGMTLIKKESKAAAVKGSGLEELLQPADRFVISSIPVTTVSVREVKPEVEAFGTISYDTREINTISARVSGRIEKIYVRYRYQHVMKGERIMDIYSPELQTAQQELLFLINNDPMNSSLINAAEQKLLLMGMNDRELQQLLNTRKPFSSVAVYSNFNGHLHEAGNSMPGSVPGSNQMSPNITEELTVKEGMYLQKGQVVFQIFNTDRSWVLLNIFPSAQKIVSVGNHVDIMPEAAPEKKFSGKIDFIEPFFRDKEKTFIARTYFNNARAQLPIGSQVRAIITGDAIVASWLPRESVLSLGLNQVVFRKVNGGFKAHPVQTGLVYQDQVQILSGLSKSDSVALNAQYLEDSEGFIKINEQP
jgi:membrane fusion protein, copper/silver efflux system